MKNVKVSVFKVPYPEKNTLLIFTSSFSIICIFTIVWNNSRALPNERIRIREAVFDKVAKSTPLPSSITPSPNVPRLGTSPETALALIRDNLQCTSSHWPAAFLLNNVSMQFKSLHVPLPISNRLGSINNTMSASHWCQNAAPHRFEQSSSLLAATSVRRRIFLASNLLKCGR